ncbi:MAG: lipase maturation factor family protein [Halobacteriales archaeon]
MGFGEPGGYWLVRWLFQRGLALIYLLAFLVAVNQFRPLVGENGLSPIRQYVDRRSFAERPSLFFFYPSDRVIGFAAWSGVVLSLVALFGIPGYLPQPFAVPAAIVVWALLWGLYLSFVNAGQVFYGFGWESMLLETGFLAIFLGTGNVAAPVVIIWLLRWVLFRNMFGAGLIKIRGDQCWRDLTCLDYHYETQPMPNPVSWFAHHLPDRFHRLEVVGNHIVELAIPFLYFAPQPAAALAGIATVVFQGWLMITGNFSWLNALTIVLAISTFDDSILGLVLPIAPPTPAPAALPVWFLVLTLLVALLVLVLSVRPVRNMLSTGQVMNTAFDPLHLVNTYGAFGSVTKHRFQIVIEGTRAADPGPEDWIEYEFKGQPVKVDKRPPQWAPYHLRLDWQLWFAAMSPSPRRHPWFNTLLERLLEGDQATVQLLRTNPFPEEPPTYVRAIRYRYEFTTKAKRKRSGRWWTRERLGTYVGPISRDQVESRVIVRQQRFR